MRAEGSELSKKIESCATCGPGFTLIPERDPSFLKTAVCRFLVSDDVRPYRLREEPAYPPALVREVLGRRIEEVVRGVQSTFRLSGVGRLVRLSVIVSDTEPLSWLAAQEDPVRVYWRGREGDLESAGIGFADVFGDNGTSDTRTVLWRLRSMLTSADRGVRYYGGMRFDESAPIDPTWSPFGRYRFYLPRFEVQSEAGLTRLVCNLSFPEDFARVKSILDRLAAMSFVTPPSSAWPDVRSRTDLPARPDWDALVRDALAEIDSARLDKIVLARRARFEFDRKPDVLALLGALRRKMPAGFHFLIQPDGDRAFLGASPEQLYGRSDRLIRSEAVAGPRGRGASGEVDRELALELMTSDKDRREHEFVRRSIIDRIGPLSASYTVDTSPTVMKLAHGQHLLARFRGTLRGDVTDADVLPALHPTPAVGGVPTNAAVRAIRKLEPFDRGWYCGPVGWIGGDGAEFAVAIRSGLVHENQIDVYSGAGLVAGSEADSEWAEIEQKIAGYTSLFFATEPVV